MSTSSILYALCRPASPLRSGRAGSQAEMTSRVPSRTLGQVPGAFRPEDIVTPSSLGLPDITDGCSVPNGKVLMLQLLCRRASPAITDKEGVVFFDDDPENVQDCLRAGYTRAVHTPEGFSRAALAAITAAGSGAARGKKRPNCALA